MSRLESAVLLAKKGIFIDAAHHKEHFCFNYMCLDGELKDPVKNQSGAICLCETRCLPITFETGLEGYWILV